jgi:hypothetical protein
VLQQAMAGLGGNGGVDDYLAGQMQGASFAKPNFYVPPPPPLPASASPVDAMDAMRAARQAALDWDLFNDNPEGGGGGDAGAEMGGDMGGPGDSGPGGGPDGGPEGSGDSYRSGGIVRRAKGGLTDYEEDMPLPPIPPEDEEDMPLPPIPPEEGGLAEKRPGFMAAGNPWNALMYAGLGTMGGTSPNALTNIGRGAMVGLEQFGKERTSAEAIAARRANAAALERYRAQTADIAAKRLQNQERKTDADIRLADQRTNKLIAAVGAAGGGRGGGGGRAKGTWEAAIQRDDDGKEVAGYNWLPADGSAPRFVPGARGKALVIEQGRGDRAKTRAELQEAATKLRGDLGWAQLDIDQQNAATRQFAAENKVSIDEARLALAGKTAETRSDDTRKNWIARRAGQLQASFFRGDVMAQAEKDYESLVGKGGGAPSAPAKPQPSPEQAAQAIRIARDSIAKGAPKKDVIQRLRDAGVTVPDDL